MGYSNETPNYHLPQYLADDRPSYLGDWNEAMSKLDTGMNDNKTDITDVDNKVFNVTQRLQTTENNMTSVLNAVDAVENKFPINTNDIQNGSIAPNKLDTNSIFSILSGLSIRAFNSTDSSADNAGMQVQAGAEVSGFYIENYKILVITYLKAGTGATIGRPFDSDSSKCIVLPNYVPAPEKEIWQTAGVYWTSENEWARWTSLVLGANRKLGVSTTKAENETLSNFGTQIFFLGGNTQGRETTGSYIDYVNNSGVL